MLWLILDAHHFVRFSLPWLFHLCQSTAMAKKLPVCPVGVFAVCLQKAPVLSHLQNPQWRLWSDWADGQADLRLCWENRSFCMFLSCASSIFILLNTSSPAFWVKFLWHLQSAPHPHQFSEVCMQMLLSLPQPSSRQREFCRSWPECNNLYVLYLFLELFEICHEKACLCHMRITKTQLSLHSHAVWSAPLLFAV